MKTETENTTPGMTAPRAAEVLRSYNAWRLGEGEWADKTWNFLGITEKELTSVLALAAEVLASEYTVRAADYDRLSAATLSLRAACKDRLPPSCYAQIGYECGCVDAALRIRDTEGGES